ncbi:MAG: hypothetical protein JNM74_00465 [Myxococcales bacterium]|nr:hypothetical protein [Myxococcales bacterium]
MGMFGFVRSWVPVARKVALLALLSACGGAGDGGGASPVVETRPVADADAGGARGDASACDPAVRSFSVPDVSALKVSHAQIDPAQVNPAANAFPDSKHQVFLPADPGTKLRDELFVILPGTNNRAQGFQTLGTLAARAGYRVVALAYESDTHPIGSCAGITSETELLACRESVWAEKVYGQDKTPRYAGDVPNSVSGRLSDLLRFLAKNQPGVGADRFLSGSDVRWDRIALLGFSQGSVVAGYIGKDQRLARLVLVAGGCDDLTVDGKRFLVPWCSAPRATPVSRTFAISHVADDTNADALVAKAFGLLDHGGYVDISANAPSYCTGTHALLSHEPTNKAHLSLALDGFIPLVGDSPRLAEDYLYAFTAPVE